MLGQHMLCSQYSDIGSLSSCVNQATCVNSSEGTVIDYNRKLIGYLFRFRLSISNLKLKVALKTGNKMADNEDRVGFVLHFILWQTINIRCWGQHKSAKVVKENDDLGLPTIYSYPGNRSKSRVWKYFGFLKLKQGPPTRENIYF